jgi:membrane dipeptidase
MSHTRREFLLGSAAAGLAAANSVRAGAADEQDPWRVQRATIVVNGLDPSAFSARYLELLTKGGVDCWHVSLGDLLSFADAHNFLDSQKPKAVLATSAASIREAREAGKIAVVFGWQGAEALGDITQTTGGVWPGYGRSSLRAYKELGLGVVGIAYNVANLFGSGNLEPHLGLTRAGKRLVEEIHKLHLVLDVAGHTGDQTSLDALALSAGVPVICSHTNVAAIADNPRCISDRLMDAIAATGGVIGITAISEFIKRGRRDAGLARTPQATLDEYLDQLDYVRKRLGPDHVGLGPDFVEGHPPATESGRNLHLFPREMTGDWPWTYVRGFESISELPNVTRGLLARGWPVADVHKVLGGNWMRVYEKVWG